MKRFSKLLLAAGVIALSLAFAGCASYRPLLGGDNKVVKSNVDVLGRVTVERETKQSGYTILLEEALKQYPNADDIVNILVDGKTLNGKQYYIMSAVVVKYKN
ncbi:MAG: hypothetical protein II563_11280 [Treponema sp.]|nr:hypothetical protein [Treponema sp.]MBQ2553409.1 hypothetical protein [Treponema sp.]MBQ4235395.1 hypothetical protein [Treponema sp.]MBQ5383590.1 hypothetical protein [Treponema sp.]